MQYAIKLIIILLVSIRGELNAQDSKTYLQQANALVNNGRYPEALEKFIQEFNDTSDNALWRREGNLYYWKRLGENYPPAIKAMVSIRDEKIERLKDCEFNSRLFNDVIAINSCLYVESKNIELYSALLHQCPSLAILCWPLVDDRLFAKKEYCIIQQVVTDPRSEYNQYEKKYKSMSQAFPDEHKFMDLKRGIEDDYVRCVERIIDFAKFIGDIKSAKEIKDRALRVLDNEKIRVIDLGFSLYRVKLHN